MSTAHRPPRERRDHTGALRFSSFAAFALACSLAACTRTAEIVETPQGPVAETAPTPKQVPVMALVHTIIPAPAQVDLSTTEVFTLTEATQIVVDAGDAEGRRIGEILARLIGNTEDTTPEVIDAGLEGQGPHIRITRGGPA